MQINTDISGSRLPAGTGSSFGGNLLRALSMMQGGKQDAAELEQNKYEFGEQMALRKQAETNRNDARIAEDNLKSREIDLENQDRNTFQSITNTTIIPDGSSEGMELVTETITPSRTNRPAASQDAFNDTDTIRMREKLLRYIPKSMEGVRTGKYLTDILDKIDDEKRTTYSKNWYAIAEQKNLKTPKEWRIYKSLGTNEDGTPSPEAENYLEKVIKENAANDGKTIALKNIEAIYNFENEANALEKSGDTSAAKSKREQASLLRDQMKGSSMTMGYDDQGRPIFQMGKGITPTVATQSRLQDTMIQFENSLELMSDLSSKLTAGDLGARGLIGEYVGDKISPQLGLDMANPDRIKNRTKLGSLREGLLRIISGDQRFSNADRSAIERLLPSNGLFESLPDAQGKIDTVRDIISDRMRVASRVLGTPPPLAVMTTEELGQAYDSGQIDEKTLRSALKRFHGYTD